MINARLSLFIVACVRSPCVGAGVRLSEGNDKRIDNARLSLFIGECVRSPCGGAGVRLDGYHVERFVLRAFVAVLWSVRLLRKSRT